MSIYRINALACLAFYAGCSGLVLIVATRAATWLAVSVLAFAIAPMVLARLFAPILVFYEYDFGDSWTHLLELTRAPREAGVKYPRCVASSRSGPPEDVGGTSGYEDFLAARRDPAHDEHKDMRRWVGRKFDPERFNLEDNNKAIARAIRRSRRSYRFRYES